MKQLITLMAALIWGLTGCQKAQEPAQESSQPMETETPTTNTLSEAEQADGWELLFDGSSVDQWRGYRSENFPQHGWEVRDGAIVVLKTAPGSTGGGDIITKKQYENFELSLEFMVSDSANSGIFYLGVEQEDKPIYWSAPEYQILDNQTFINMEDLDIEPHTHLTGDNYDLQGADEDHSLPVGQWNQAKIVVNNGHVEHWLNGHKTIEYQINSDSWKELVAASKFGEHPEYAQATKGYIGLQDHGHEVSFRNIKLKEL